MNFAECRRLDHVHDRFDCAAIILSSPAPTEYLHTASEQVSFGVTDSVSGIANASNGQTIELLTIPLGVHIFSVSASDRAGNTAATGLGFTVVATIPI